MHYNYTKIYVALMGNVAYLEGRVHKRFYSILACLYACMQGGLPPSTGARPPGTGVSGQLAVATNYIYYVL